MIAQNSHQEKIDLFIKRNMLMAQKLNFHV